MTVLCHPVPLRDQGTWAPFVIAPVGSLAHKPPEISWETAAIFPVPALTAEQVVGEALALHGGETLLVNGAGGITGGLIVQLAALRGVDVLATASPRSADRVCGYGAREVIDYRDPLWPQHARALAKDSITAVANAAPGGAAAAMTALADGGRLATITPDPPAPTRGISVTAVYVRSDGSQLEPPHRATRVPSIEHARPRVPAVWIRPPPPSRKSSQATSPAEWSSRKTSDEVASKNVTQQGVSR